MVKLGGVSLNDRFSNCFAYSFFAYKQYLRVGIAKLLQNVEFTTDIIELNVNIMYEKEKRKTGLLN